MKKDHRLRGIVVTISAILLLGTVIILLPGVQPLPWKEQLPEPVVNKILPPISPRLDPQGHQKEARDKEIDTRFKQAATMLHARQYDYAIKALHRVLELSPRMPEAHTNMGFALIGLEEYKAAADFFDTATTLQPQQNNAYYGLALAYEGQQNYLLALSAMESFIHLVDDTNPYKNKAHAAVWEWREKIKEQDAQAATVISDADGGAQSTPVKQP